MKQNTIKEQIDYTWNTLHCCILSSHFLHIILFRFTSVSISSHKNKCIQKQYWSWSCDRKSPLRFLSNIFLCIEAFSFWMGIFFQSLWRFYIVPALMRLLTTVLVIYFSYPGDHKPVFSVERNFSRLVLSSWIIALKCRTQKNCYTRCTAVPSISPISLCLSPYLK